MKAHVLWMFAIYIWFSGRTVYTGDINAGELIQTLAYTEYATTWAILVTWIAGVAVIESWQRLAYRKLVARIEKRHGRGFSDLHWDSASNEQAR